MRVAAETLPEPLRQEPGSGFRSRERGGQQGASGRIVQWNLQL